MRPPAPDAPLELHGNVTTKPQTAVAPPAAHLGGTDPSAAAGTAPAPLAANRCSRAGPRASAREAQCLAAQIRRGSGRAFRRHRDRRAHHAQYASGCRREWKSHCRGEIRCLGSVRFCAAAAAAGRTWTITARDAALRACRRFGSECRRIGAAEGQGRGHGGLAEPGKATVLLADPTANTEAPKAETPAAATPAPGKARRGCKARCAFRQTGGRDQDGGDRRARRLFRNRHSPARRASAALFEWKRFGGGHRRPRRALVGEGRQRPRAGHYAVRADQIDNPAV